jgi:hypothetical protein
MRGAMARAEEEEELPLQIAMVKLSHWSLLNVAVHEVGVGLCRAFRSCSDTRSVRPGMWLP